MPSPRQLVKKHTEKSGTSSHVEEGPDGMREEVQYQVYDCKYCDAEGITSKANFDTWEEVWMSARDHLNQQHPEKLDQ